MNISFLHSNQAFLPEIEAYTKFFEDYGIKTRSGLSGVISNKHTDVEWRFMGTNFGHRNKEKLSIHEYSSCSTAPFRKLKDFTKRWFNSKPDYRLFLNEYVKQQFNFQDHIPFGLRDMGIYTHLESSICEKKNKRYDFIYAGSVAPERKMEELLNCFTTTDLREHSLLILSKDYEGLAKKYQGFPGICFRGPVPHQEALQQISTARFAINYTAVKEPFEHQTSSKLLEYAALKIPIITTDYRWVQEFQARYGGNFFYLSGDLSNFTWRQINEFDYSFPMLEEWTWEKQIRKSGVLELFESNFPGLRF